MVSNYLHEFFIHVGSWRRYEVLLTFLMTSTGPLQFCTSLWSLFPRNWNFFGLSLIRLGHPLGIPMVYILGLPASSFVAKLFQSTHMSLQRFASTPWWIYKLVGFSGIEVINDMEHATYCLERSLSYQWTLLTVEAKLSNIEHLDLILLSCIDEVT